MAGFVYPIAAGWAWYGGWLGKLNYIDAAGSGCVHVVGGTAGFWGTIILGPRIGFFGKTVETLKSKQKKDQLNIAMTEDDNINRLDTSRALKVEPEDINNSISGGVNNILSRDMKN